MAACATTAPSPTSAPARSVGSPAAAPRICPERPSYPEGAMPELPEVETIRRQLAPRVEGRTLVHVRVDDERWCFPLRPREMERALAGRRVEALGRRGKYL